MPDQVIELSVEETNELRRSLGLAPLRTERRGGDDRGAPASATVVAVAAPSSGAGDGEAVLELSVEQSNALRRKLGLAPLRVADGGGDRGHATEVAVAPGAAEADRAAAERLEAARLRRQVERGIAAFAENYAVDEEKSGDVVTWALAMKQKPTDAAAAAPSTKAPTGRKSKTSQLSDGDYSEQDLTGLRVAHAASELQEGSTTVMTLADASILETDDTSRKVLGLRAEEAELENVDLVDQRNVSEGLKAKRIMEMGLGRAGGYAGYDDDEFEELGGTMGPSRVARGFGHDTGKDQKKPRGFQIGAVLKEQEEELEKDLFARHRTAMSLESAGDVAASEYMTVEEAENERRSKKSKKESSFKKKSKKDKKKKKMRQVESDEDEDNDDTIARPTSVGLIAELEETAVEDMPRRLMKRRRSENESPNESMPYVSEDPAIARRRFDAAMSKANERSQSIFAPKEAATAGSPAEDEEPDDAFLNAALAKARRLNRLKEMSGASIPLKGTDAVVTSLQHGDAIMAPAPAEIVSSGGITFSVDETSEFTRALRAKVEQTTRKSKSNGDTPITAALPVTTLSGGIEESTEDADMADLAKEMNDDQDEDESLDETTASLGRGLGGVLGLLKQTGELTRPNAAREEMRGRAKDKKTYEDYEKLDLSQVVRIGDNATERDKEFASREIKLEYRDKNGRLLTRKEAFRELCYQFHGHGSGKRKEEKRNAQISREQSEARVTSRQASEGIFGALKATQKATGKAFVVHKT